MTKHINPGTDTTINPVVIDDSKRGKPRPPCEECIYQAKAAEAQQRIDAAIKELQYVVRADVNEDTECHILQAIALLQAGGGE